MKSTHDSLVMAGSAPRRRPWHERPRWTAAAWLVPMTVSLAAAWSTFDALRDASVDSNVRFAAALVVVAPLVAEANGCISLVLSFLIAIRYPTGEPRLRRAVIYAGAAAVLVGVVTFLLVAAAARAAWEANPVH